jgi:hypothetical protein
VLAAAILPLSTAYSVCDLTGSPAALDSPFAQAREETMGDLVVGALGAVAQVATVVLVCVAAWA